jgi:hypothetical protein
MLGMRGDAAMKPNANVVADPINTRIQKHVPAKVEVPGEADQEFAPLGAARQLKAVTSMRRPAP